MLRQFLAENGITHLTTPPHTPEHNGISERKHRHIVETGLTLLGKASMPKSYWSYAFTTAVYLINRMITPVLGNESPYAKLFGQSPNYQKLQIFGCECYPWLRPYTHHKLDNRSAACVFIGYSLTQSAYLCLHRDTGRIYTSRHVTFDETKFPFAVLEPRVIVEEEQELRQDSRPATVVPASPLIPASIVPPCSAPHQQPQQTPPSSASSSTHSSQASSPPASPQPQATTNPIPPANQNPPTYPNTNPAINPNPADPQPLSSEPSNQLPTSTSQPAQAQPPNQHPMRTRSKNNITKPKFKLSLTATTTNTPLKPYIPKTVAEALRDPNWRKAMCDEINAQLRNGTSELVPPDPRHNIVGCKWVFTIKYLPDGEIDRYKAPLVEKRFHQQHGLDFTETFSPVIKSTTVRSVLHVAVTNGWPIRQIDVNNAFLQGTLDDEVYVTQPPGFVDQDHPHHVCTLYGLKQAPRAWYQELRAFLLTQGFQNSLADASLFIYKHGKDVLYVLVYVDDMLITGNNNTLLQRFLQTIATRFSLKDLGDMSYFLGIEATRNARGLHLMQKKYVIDLLKRTNMLDARPVSSPMSPTPKLSLNSGTPLINASEYRMVLGSLQYLSFTGHCLCCKPAVSIHAQADGHPLASCQENIALPRRHNCSWNLHTRHLSHYLTCLFGR